MSVVSVANFARTVGAWMILSAITLSFGVQFLTGIREARTESWLSAEFCRSTASPEGDRSTRADAKLTDAEAITRGVPLARSVTAELP